MARLKELLRPLAIARRPVEVELLTVTRLAVNDWRVSSVHPKRTIGHVARLSEGRFQVLWLDPPGGVHDFTTFTRALAALVDGARQSGARRRTSAKQRR